jgi:hypothetical protein
MAKRAKTPSEKTLTDRVTLGQSFAKISLVEGIRLTRQMEKRAAKAVREQASPEAYRETIVQSYRKK